ncbi:hypothetical protein pb186bvf_010017 [Paramecium bursaria]
MKNIQSPSITLYNNSKPQILLAQINVEKGPNIQILYGQTNQKKKYDIVIEEQRKTDLDFSLNLKRYGYVSTEGQHQINQINVISFIDQNIQTNRLDDFNIVETELQENLQGFETRRMFVIKIPPCVTELADEMENEERLVFPYEHKYRSQYQQQYSEIFNEIDQTNQQIAIVYLPTNNPLLGINNYYQVQDIVDVILNLNKQSNYQIISEKRHQALILANGFIDYLNAKNIQVRNLESYQFMKEEPQFEEIRSQISLDVLLNQPQQQIYIGNNRSNSYIYQRQDLNFISIDIVKSQPILDNDDNTCLCGQPLCHRRGQKNRCSYCMQERRTFLICKDRICDRTFCNQCSEAAPSIKKCYLKHKLKYVMDREQGYLCDICDRRSLNIILGKFRCITCDFDICGNCFITRMANYHYKKILLYATILEQKKGHYKTKTKQSLIFKYLQQLEYDDYVKELS